MDVLAIVVLAVLLLPHSVCNADGNPLREVQRRRVNGSDPGTYIHLFWKAYTSFVLTCCLMADASPLPCIIMTNNYSRLLNDLRQLLTLYMPAHPTFPANLFSPCAALAGDCEGKLRQYKIHDHCIGLHFSAGLKSSKEGSPLTSVDCNNAPMWSFTKDRFEYQRTGLCMSFSAESIALNPTLNQGDFTRVVLKRCDKNDLGQQFEYKDGMIRWHRQESTNDLCMETEGCSTDVGAQLRLWGGCDRNSDCYAISTGACDRDEEGGGAEPVEGAPEEDRPDCDYKRGLFRQDHCCNPTHPCYEAQGDCDDDDECAGDLVCGHTSGKSPPISLPHPQHPFWLFVS